jgi:hypothetical protein
LKVCGKLATDVGHPPSFDIGFEKLELPPQNVDDSFETTRRSLRKKTACLIWIENIDGQPISDCRVVLEDFQPRLPQMVPGAMLLSVNENDQIADLASSERRYFRFIDYRLGFKVITQTSHGNTVDGLASLAKDLESPSLPIGERFSATIVAHGNNAGSRRLNLTIDTISETELHVATSDSTPVTDKRAHQQQGKQSAL